MTQNGTISGTPYLRGTYSFTVYVSDSADPVHTGLATLTISIS
jgi:hypothetical protein